MSVYSSTVSALTEMSVKGIATIDDCILDNATNPVAKSIYENLMNFAKGTGVWIVLAMIALGTIIFLATESTSLPFTPGRIIFNASACALKTIL